MMVAYGNYMKIKDLFTNANGEMSTTNTIQMLSAITLCLGLVLSLVLDRAVAGEISIALSGMATLTATSKGFISNKIRDTKPLGSKSENQNE